MKKILTIALLLLLIVCSAFAWTRLEKDPRNGLKDNCETWYIFNKYSFNSKYCVASSTDSSSILNIFDRETAIKITVVDSNETIILDWRGLKKIGEMKLPFNLLTNVKAILPFSSDFAVINDSSLKIDFSASDFAL